MVIPCLNGARTLPELFDALADQSLDEDWEIVVADNGSDDGTVEVIERYQERLPQLRIVDASARRGQSFAMNTGAREARGEWLAFCDADDVVGVGWLSAVATALERHELISYAQDEARLNPNWLQESRERIFSYSLPTTWFPPFVPFTGAGCMAMHREVFEELGGFDEQMPLEDLDFCLKAHLQGRELVLAPDAVLHYRYRQTYGGIFRQAYIVRSRRRGRAAALQAAGRALSEAAPLADHRLAADVVAHSAGLSPRPPGEDRLAARLAVGPLPRQHQVPGALGLAPFPPVRR